MTILGILLTILKILGIIILVLLLLILTVILLLLFVPFRYKVHADKVGWDLNAGGNVSWLLHMVSVDVSYGIRESGYGGGLTKDIRIFGISIFRIRDWLSSRKKKKSKAAGPSDTDSTSSKESAASSAGSFDGSMYAAESVSEAGESPLAVSEEGAASGIAEEGPPGTESGSTEEQSGSAEEQPGSAEEQPGSAEEQSGSAATEIGTGEPVVDTASEARSRSGRISGILQTVNELLLSLPGRIYEILVTIFMKVLEFFTMFCGIPGRIVAVCGTVIDRMLTVFGKITLITDFFFDDRTQDAIHLLLGNTGNLLGHIRPRKLSGYLDFGFDDPSITGRVLGILSVFLPQVGKTFDINPDFEKSHLECDITSSGRIYLFYLIYIAASTYFNKNIKYVIRYVRHLRKELSQA